MLIVLRMDWRIALRLWRRCLKERIMERRKWFYLMCTLVSSSLIEEEDGLENVGIVS